MEHVPPNITHFNKRCTSISTSITGRPVVTFTDGTTYEADIVIGADGIKSVVRGAVVGDAPGKQAAFSNTVAYRGLVPIATLKAAGVKTDLSLHPVCFMGKDGVRRTFFSAASSTQSSSAPDPVPHQRWRDRKLWCTILSTFPTNSQFTSSSRSTLLPSARTTRSQSGPQISVLESRGSHLSRKKSSCINLKDGEATSLHCSGVYAPLTSGISMLFILCWKHMSRGGLFCLETQSALLHLLAWWALTSCPKAHGMLPHLGAGAGQGLEDGLVLAKLLGHPLTNTSNIDVSVHIVTPVRCFMLFILDCPPGL